MPLVLYLSIIVLSSVLFVVPIHRKHIVAAGLLGLGAIAILFCAFRFGQTGNLIDIKYTLGILGTAHICVDMLSIFFLILISIAGITGILYSKNYLKEYVAIKTPNELSLHYISYVLMYFSMVGVVIFRDMASFLIAWELMAISSFVSLLLDANQKEKLRTAIQYIVQMHIGFFILVVAFVVAGSASGASGFDALNDYFAQNKNLPLFILFFLGFGLKAGFVPVHTWLPDTYAMMPGSVSGFISGAVTKMGVYGLLRVASSLQNQLFEIGIILLIVSVASGLFGIVMATIQKDIKRLLAYSSIENIGIIGIGLSMAILGKFWDNYTLMVAGIVGALIHTFNHSLFKSILFFSAGLVCKAADTQNIDQMGGIIKRMPNTSSFFIFGALGICALPPFNGFVSEFILYNGFFAAMYNANPVTVVLVVLSIISLVLIGGLSIMAFAKTIGVGFLGEPRSQHTAAAKAKPKEAWLPMLIPFAVAVFPYMFISVFCKMAEQTFGIDHVNAFSISQGLISIYKKLCIVNVLLLAIFGLLYFVRRSLLRKRNVEHKPTWGCGYTASTVRQQYTSASFVNDFAYLTNPLTRYKREMKPIAEDEIFPQPRRYKGKDVDIISVQLVTRPTQWINKRFFKLAIFQTGRLQHYVSYALLFMVMIFILTYFNLI